MNIKLMSVLGIVCLMLILVIIGEWFYAGWTQNQVLMAITTPEKKSAHDEMPTIELTKQTEASYTDLVARPLFIKGRKPVDEPTPEEVQASAAAAVVVVFDWELSGIYTTNKGLSGLFSRSKSKAAKDNYRKISVGADLDGWKLTEISTDRAVLKQGTQEKQLLLRKQKLKDLTPKTNAPNLSNVPNQPNAPQPEEDNQPPPPAEGETENTNE
jgi:hypothetical protein